MPRFAKYSGAGNDFVLVRAEEIGLGDAGLLARRMCPRRTGVGVDGLVLVRSLSEDAVRVRFLNPDGSEFGTCGNGSRCAARYAVERGLVGGAELLLVTDDGEIAAHVDGERVTLDFALDAAVEREISVEVEGESRKGWLVRMGTPHAVVPVRSVELDDFEAAARPIRAHPSLGEAGANVDLVELRGDEAVVRTFERGVEGETLACGSGCMAVAFALSEAGLAGDALAVRTRSGAVLSIERTGGRLRLAGPAHHVFDGVFPDTPIRSPVAGGS
ncbi:MAG: diaminopimelate epimerase [Gemmatimonadota bacterium]